MCSNSHECLQEVAVSLGLSADDYLYDVVTAHQHRGRNGCPNPGVALLDGMVEADRHECLGLDGSIAKSHSTQLSSSKADREAHFPDLLIDKAIAVQLEHGAASVESDRVHILNSIVGRT